MLKSDNYLIIGSYNTAKRIILFNDNSICIDYGNYTVNYKDVDDLMQNCTELDRHVYKAMIVHYIRDYR